MFVPTHCAKLSQLLRPSFLSVSFPTPLYLLAVHYPSNGQTIIWYAKHSLKLLSSRCHCPLFSNIPSKHSRVLNLSSSWLQPFFVLVGNCETTQTGRRSQAAGLCTSM